MKQEHLEKFFRMMKSIPKSQDLLLFNVQPTKPQIKIEEKMDNLLEEFKK